MRRRPSFSVTSRSPPGSGSTAHGFTSPVATTVTSKATLDGVAQARVCWGKACCWSVPFLARVSSGLGQGAPASATTSPPLLEVTIPGAGAPSAAILPSSGAQAARPASVASVRAAGRRARVVKRTGLDMDGRSLG